jgi:hypothetical protein
MRTTVFDDYSENIEDNELMEQIEDAIRYEVERQIMLESQIFEFLESEEFACISLYEQDDNSVVCPICRYNTFPLLYPRCFIHYTDLVPKFLFRNSVMVVSDLDCTATCACGAWLDLSVLRPIPAAQSSSSGSAQPPGTCGAALKQRLGDAYDRCVPYAVSAPLSVIVLFYAFIGQLLRTFSTHNFNQ